MIKQELNILLVEDDDVDAMAIKRALNKRRISNNMVRAVNGVEALEMLHAGAVSGPYVVLLDLNMPRMNGLEFLQAVRDDPKLRRTTVFVLTTSERENDIVQSYNLNVAGYFLKESLSHEVHTIVDVLDAYWTIVVMPPDADT